MDWFFTIFFPELFICLFFILFGSVRLFIIWQNNKHHFGY